MSERAPRPHSVRFEPFELELDSRELRADGRSVRLAEQPFQLLVALLERPGEVVGRDQLRGRLWNDDTFVDFEGAINTAVRKLRHALGDSAAAPRYIETVVKRGYRFIAAVELAASAATTPFLYGLIWGTREFPLASGVNTVGRADEAKVRIDVHSVSRLHARVIVEGDQAVIEDLGSKNGTWVGGRRVSAPVLLADGDSIRLGTVPVVFRCHATMASTATMCITRS